jgi:hypothetical protein
MLTPAERAAGRAFRTAGRWLLAAREAEYPARSHCPAFMVWFRHDCAGRGSWALFLHQHYLESPAYFPGIRTEVLPGRFVFTWREAVCPRCKMSVRSTDGILLLGGDCLLEKGAASHAADELRAFHSGQGDAPPSP